MVRTIDINVQEPVLLNFWYATAYRIRIDVTGVTGDGLDPNLFIYLPDAPNPYTGQTDARFQAVAGPADIATLPIGAPDPQRNYPFFRLPYLVADVRSKSIADKLHEAVRVELDSLVQTLARFDQLSTVRQTTFTEGQKPLDT